MVDPRHDLSAHGYEVLEVLTRIPEGGRIAYLAEDRDGRRVVVKRFGFASFDASWSGYREVEREIQMLEELEHPRIPAYLGSFATDDGYCLVQQWLDLPPISARDSFSPAEVKTIALSLPTAARASPPRRPTRA